MSRENYKFMRKFERTKENTIANIIKLVIISNGRSPLRSNIIIGNVIYLMYNSIERTGYTYNKISRYLSV